MTNPKDKEWYEDEEWAYPGNAEYDIPKIVAEAERRGRVAAWEEAKAMVIADSENHPDSTMLKASWVVEGIDDKLSALYNSQRKEI